MPAKAAARHDGALPPGVTGSAGRAHRVSAASQLLGRALGNWDGDYKHLTRPRSQALATAGTPAIPARTRGNLRCQWVELRGLWGGTFPTSYLALTVHSVTSKEGIAQLTCRHTSPGKVFPAAR